MQPADYLDILGVNPIFPGFQWRETLLEREFLAFLVGPERLGNDPVRAEHHHEPLLAPLLVGEPEARQVQDERQGGRADPQVADELAGQTSRCTTWSQI